MPKATSYQTERDAKDMIKVRELESRLPTFIKACISAISVNTTPRTRVAYLYDIQTFLRWWWNAVPELQERRIADVTLEDFAKITTRDIEEYIEYLQTDCEHPNSRTTISRKLSALATLYRYLYRHGDIETNPCGTLERPKPVKDHRIIYLNSAEVNTFLACIENGSDAIPKQQAAYLANTRVRDFAIAMLLLGTGIRVSECVGLNLEDVDVNNRRIQVSRKGGKFEFVSCNTDVVKALQAHLVMREKIVPATDKDKNAVFLSLQRTRITKESIERMITKYAKFAGVEKHITPHKLRKTFGTALYKESRDVYIVANALGHDNVATTTAHYVDDDEESLQALIDRMTFYKTADEAD